MIRIIISDEFGQHGIDIKTAISNGYGSDISEQIEIIAGWSGYAAALYQARNNPDIIALIRSVSGVADYVADANSVYPRIQTFFPLGGNENIFAEVFVFQTNEPPVIITSGAGDEELRNNTSYGKGLEFWDQDLNTPTPAEDQSSFSNGYVLGKLLKIKDTLNCTWWEARYRARITADRTEPNRVTSSWDLRNGYGKINVDAAIAYTGLVPSDPYVESTLQDTIDQLTADNAQYVIDNAALQSTNDQLTIDNAALKSSNDQLTIDNAALTADNLRLNGFNYTDNVAGITLTKETKYGTSEALTLGKITIEENARIAVVLKHCLSANDLDKEPLELATEYFDDTFVKDFIYSKYCEAKEIALSNLIVQ